MEKKIKCRVKEKKKAVASKEGIGWLGKGNVLFNAYFCPFSKFAYYTFYFCHFILKGDYLIFIIMANSYWTICIYQTLFSVL